MNGRSKLGGADGYVDPRQGLLTLSGWMCIALPPLIGYSHSITCLASRYEFEHCEFITLRPGESSSK